LDALTLSAEKNLFSLPLVILKHPAQTVSRMASLPVPESYQSALSSENLGAQAAIVIAGLEALHALEDARCRRVVVEVGFSAILYADSFSLA
jgi:hypothetical protein